MNTAEVELTNTLNPYALTQWVTRVPWQTSADWPHAAMDAMGTDPTGVRSTCDSVVGDRASMLVKVEVTAGVTPGVGVVALRCGIKGYIK